MMNSFTILLAIMFVCTSTHASAQIDDSSGGATQLPIQISGIFPHLTMRNNENECGTGAVVVWQGDLWAVTYAPHAPNGSSDKLYQITPALDQKIFADSVGGTPANRMIHELSNQLLIGPYLIDQKKNIRTIPPSKMFGRLTGNARHLTDPNKVYYATMEEGLYEVDVNTLEAKCLIRDGNSGSPKIGVRSKLPGYHGKGLYSGQGRVVYSNNGEHGRKAKKDPTTASGAFAQWFGEGDWKLIRRNQFTEITGPGGITGNPKPDTDPIWAMGWDAKSLIVALLEGGAEDGVWQYYRLPKASHSYDGAHGWNTEWPRIREIGAADLLATMHGTFWRFPKSFSKGNSKGIAPRSNYLKVVGDFCIWNEKVVLGGDDSARAEFLNTRDFKAQHAAPKQSNSNLWFLDPKQLDELGPAIGRGSVWLREDLTANAISDSFLFSGYDYRQLHLSHESDRAVTFLLETDQEGTDRWTTMEEISLQPGQAVSRLFADHEKGAWIRLTSQQPALQVTANFQFRNRDRRTTENHSMFDGIASPKSPAEKTVGLMRSLAFDKLGIVASSNVAGDSRAYYELDQKMELTRVDDDNAAGELVKSVQQPSRAYQFDGASVVIEEDGNRFRLPFNNDYLPVLENKPDTELDAGYQTARVCREVATERDLLNIHGTFYELPARNAQGLAKLRPIATHNLSVHDYCSHGGLLLFAGIDKDASGSHIFRSQDGVAAIWAGVVDDLWKLGKPRGKGGPWLSTPVEANVPSDPYLMTAFDRKSVEITAADNAKIRLEVDVDGTGLWVPYKALDVEAEKTIKHVFPEGFSAYWVRAISNLKTTATVQFTYE